MEYKMEYKRAFETQKLTLKKSVTLFFSSKKFFF